MINYGYFRHRFDAHTNPKLNDLVDEMGIAAYGYYYTLIELYGAKYADRDENSCIELHRRVVANTWRKRVDSCDKVLTKLQLSGLLVYTKSKNTYSLSIPNFSKYYGSYKKRDTPTPPNKRKEKKRKEKESKVNIYPSTKEIKKTNYKVTPQEIIELWNEASGNNFNVLPKAKTLNSKRISAINSCLKEYSEMRNPEDWEKYFKIVFETPFLTGASDKAWKASFDWVINKTNLLKIVEGNYSQDPRNLNRSKYD